MTMLAAISPYLPSLSSGAAILVAAVVFAAGVLRGFTGFGFALVAVPTISLFVDPAEVVPAIVIVAAVAGAEVLPKAWRSVDWRRLRLLLAGAALGTPVGMYGLKALPADLMRAIIGLIVLAAVALLWRGFKLKAPPPAGARFGIGALSGLLNGGTAMGGPPVIIYFLASPEGIAVGRASLLVYFFLLSIWNTAINVAGGLVTIRTLVFAALMVPLMAAGNRIGDRWFDESSAVHYQRVALWFLAVIAALGIGRALL
jgi:hypothetical protein